MSRPIRFSLNATLIERDDPLSNFITVHVQPWQGDTALEPIFLVKTVDVEYQEYDNVATAENFALAGIRIIARAISGAHLEALDKDALHLRDQCKPRAKK